MSLPDDDQIALVQSTFALVEPIADTAAELFYGRLFETTPEVRPLFADAMSADGMAEQRRKLMATLGVVTRGLDDLGELLPVAAQLAQRHVGYGVEPQHYDSVGAALLWTLEQGLGDAYTDEAAEAWTVTYGALATAMIDAAYPAEKIA